MDTNEEKIVHNLIDDGISPDATCKDCKKIVHGRKIIGKELQKALEYEWYPIESNLIPCKVFTQANGVLPYLVQAPATLGQLLRKTAIGPTELLARFLDMGKITLEEIALLDAQYQLESDAATNSFNKKHEI